MGQNDTISKIRIEALLVFVLKEIFIARMTFNSCHSKVRSLESMEKPIHTMNCQARSKQVNDTSQFQISM